VARATQVGLPFVELRQRRPVEAGHPGSAALLSEARAALALAPGSVVLVNDRVDLAILSGAAGAHVGQDDLPAGAARRLLGPDRWLGLSTHDEAELGAAQDLPLDYVAVGPIHPSATKSGHAATVGVARLSAWRPRSRLPVVAIGGVTADRARAVMEAGADAVAVAGALAADMVGEARRLRWELGEPEPARHWYLTGFSGAGKTTLAPLVAALHGPGREAVDLDDLVATRAGAPVADVLQAEGEIGLRAREAAALAALPPASSRPLVVALGGGTLLGDASRRLVVSSGILAWLRAPLDTCLRRARQAGGRRPLLEQAENDAELAVLMAEREPGYHLAAVDVDATGRPDEIARRLAATLGGKPESPGSR
jgi:thiamine-phosphate pyrophosphorylase